MNTALSRLIECLRLSPSRGVLLSAPADVRWATGGFAEGELVLITAHDAILLTASPWGICPDPGFRVIHQEGSLVRQLTQLCIDLKLEQLIYREDALPVDRYRRLKAALDDVLWLQPQGSAIRALRAVKDQREIAAVAEACEVTCRAFRQFVPCLKEGITEREAVRRMNVSLFQQGAEGLAFPTIVSFGKHTAEVHHRASDRALRRGDTILVDTGAAVDGYAADFTRMLHLGSPDEAFIRCHQAVRKALEAAEALLIPGTSCRKLDQAARQALSESGFSPDFPHALGHGLGLEIHETPSLSPRSADVLKPGMTVAIEPSVTVSGSYGIRL